MGLIYVITSPSGKQYVGQTTGPIKKRFKEHACDCAGHRHLAIKCAFRKYGKAAMDCSVLMKVPDVKLNEMERHFIEVLDTYKNGYNATPGGEQSPMKIPEVVAKMKKTMASPIVKKKLSDAQKRNHARPGAKEKRSKALKAAHARPETKARFKAAWAAAQGTPEQRAVNSAAQLIAQKNPATNAKRSKSLIAANKNDATINERRSKALKETNKRDPSIKQRRIETLKRTLAAKKAARAAHLSSGTTTSAHTAQ